MIGWRGAWVMLAAAGLAACQAQPGPGAAPGGQRPEAAVRLDPGDVALPEGYVIEAVAVGLTSPAAVAFDAHGTAHVIDSGAAGALPRLVRLGAAGPEQVAAGGGEGPWTGLTFSDGGFVVTEAVADGAARVLRIGPRGAGILAHGLPSGDHPLAHPLRGPDGWIYFTQGTATNSGVVGDDNLWRLPAPQIHDVPCQDIALRGGTGAFLPSGRRGEARQIIPGAIPCSGAILRIPPRGGRPELVAWGLRDPGGLAFAPDGRLFAVDRAAQPRGSRPVEGASDVLWSVQRGVWYGWPDFAGGEPVAAAPVLATPPNPPPGPVVRFAAGAEAAGIDFARNPAFGGLGHAFVALAGGHKVVRVDPAGRQIAEFAVNRAGRDSAASALGKGGLERPVALRFDPAGTALYVVDQGVVRDGRAVEGTGAVWRIQRRGG